jgi:hypothetical protein
VFEDPVSGRMQTVVVVEPEAAVMALLFARTAVEVEGKRFGSWQKTGVSLEQEEFAVLIPWLWRRTAQIVRWESHRISQR